MSILIKSILTGSGSSSTSISTAVIAGIAVGGCVILIALALVAVYALKQRKKANEAAVLANPFGTISDLYLILFKSISQQGYFQFFL